MTREEFDLCVARFDATDFNASTKLIHKAAEYITSLEATIEAQEIIIKDKTSIIEAMSQPKVVYTDFKKVNLAKAMGIIK